MLNISNNSVSEYIRLQDFKSSRLLKSSRISRLSLWLFLGLLIFIISCLFLPWFQNVNSKGYVTTRLPDQRPQNIQSVIAGRLDQWYVKEGDYVNRGDTIAHISEVKAEYFNPDLLIRTKEQISAKEQSVTSYDSKVDALQNQYAALEKAYELKRQQILNKIEQTENKIRIDSIDLVAFQANLQIAQNQLVRVKDLEAKGLKSLSDLQDKEYKLQESRAKVTVQENKLLNQKNSLQFVHLELDAVEQEYADKLAKSQSDMQSALSAKLESVADAAKLKNQLGNYSQRQQFYYITAPQSGYITKTLKAGVGETLKEGASIATIMPQDYDLAVEVYIEPQDLPLIEIGNIVRLRFDGWPAIVISGWPKASTGIFTGNVVAIDRYNDDNGAYRVMISPDNTEKKWPEELRVGTGSMAFIMLKEVPIWYEIWRQLNGFPPDYYRKNEKAVDEVKRKAPLKSVK